mmetsp:Transcript_27009/g.49057  ORF Transcript_27009/g.49057 Transcript_27009/m.49057 type:complete len:97 (-) Transcript_27009:500-790(-)
MRADAADAHRRPTALEADWRVNDLTRGERSMMVCRRMERRAMDFMMVTSTKICLCAAVLPLENSGLGPFGGLLLIDVGQIRVPVDCGSVFFTCMDS